MNSATALVLAAAGVGFGHAALPDHWAPLALIGRTRREPLGRTVRRSLVAAGTHVLLSLLLGAVLIAVGLRLRATVVHDEGLVVGGLLLATGLVFLVLDLRGHGHGHPHPHPHPHPHDHDHGHDHDHDHGRDHVHSEGRLRATAAVAVPFGAAASPDLTILPVFLAASAYGGAVAVGSLLVFALATIGTIVGLTVAASLGAARLAAPWLERRANLLTAATLLVLGAAVATGLL